MFASSGFDPLTFWLWAKHASTAPRRAWAFLHHAQDQSSNRNRTYVQWFLWPPAETSSASIERVFSQVKRILASVGENILEDNLELRLLRRCCKKLEVMTLESPWYNKYLSVSLWDSSKIKYSMGGAHHTFCMEAHMFCMESGSKSGKLWLAPLIEPKPSTRYTKYPG